MKGYTNIGLLLSVGLLASCANGLNAAADDGGWEKHKNMLKGAGLGLGLLAGGYGFYHLSGSKHGSDVAVGASFFVGVPLGAYLAFRDTEAKKNQAAMQNELDQAKESVRDLQADIFKVQRDFPGLFKFDESGKIRRIQD